MTILPRMNPDEMGDAFEEAQRQLAALQSQSAQFNQAIGFISSVIQTTKPYWVQLAAESGNNAVAMPILESGRATVNVITTALSTIQDQYTPPIAAAHTASLSASFFGSNTAATSSFIPLNGHTQFSVQAIPVPDFLTDKSLADRFSKLDPALGRVCAEIWESLYGTTADPERSALFMIRQTWDHFFQILAPDETVRKSEFWKEKEGPRPDLVTREERFRFAVARCIKDPNKQSMLNAACKQMLDLYGELNRAHERGEIQTE